MEDVLKLIQPRPCLQVGSQKVVGTGFGERLQNKESRPSRQAVGKELADPFSKAAGFLEEAPWTGATESSQSSQATCEPRTFKVSTRSNGKPSGN